MATKKKEAVYRHEYKYLCTEMQSAILKMRAEGILKSDSHCGEEGCYRIRSLYFDSLYDKCYYENEAGVDDRDKYRIRIYNNNPEYIVLEKKSKKKQMTLKVSCRIDESICRKLMNRENVLIEPFMQDVQKQLLAELQYKGMRPVVIVDYIRYPFIEKNGNVRITFDENIASSNDISKFLDSEIILRPILGTGKRILEVKWDELLPDYIKTHMQLDELQWNSFSKYYLCRKYNTLGGIK